MAEITSILRAVAAPELTSPGYGQSVNTQFENINAKSLISIFFAEIQGMNI